MCFLKRFKKSIFLPHEIFSFRLRRAQLSQSNGSSQQSQDDKKDFSEEAKLLFGAIEVRDF